MTETRFENFVFSRMMDAALVARANAGSMKATKKDVWLIDQSRGVSDIVTDVDVFIQQYLGLSVLSYSETITVFGEEHTEIIETHCLSEDTLIVDPIDGTKWFASGSEKYGILAARMRGGQVTWAGGIFPSSGEHYATHLPRPPKQPLGSTIHPVRSIFAHYRIMGDSYIALRKNIEASGISICTNVGGIGDDGFGTNLSAVRAYAMGDIDIFIAPLMNIVDAFPTAKLLQYLGATLAFFDGDTEGRWQPKPD